MVEWRNRGEWSGVEYVLGEGGVEWGRMEWNGGGWSGMGRVEWNRGG